MKTNSENHETDIVKACETAIALSEKSTQVVGWYDHNYEVRGPYGRWFQIDHKEFDYNKVVYPNCVSEPWDDTKFCAFALNNVASIAKAYLDLRMECDQMMKKVKK